MKETPIRRGEARGLEETFTDRFELSLRKVGDVLNPLDGKVYPIGRGAPTFYHKGSEVAERMKSLGVFERDLLDEMPRNRLAVLRLRRAGFLASRTVKVVVAAVVLSPLEELILEKESTTRLGLAEMNGAVDDLVRQPEVFYYLGVLSTTGWSEECKGRLAQGPNFITAAVENRGGSRWKVSRDPDRRWGRVHLAFDPETRPEKLARAREFFLGHESLQIKGGHVVLEHAREDLGVPEDILQRAVQDMVHGDPQLQVMEVSGKQILKRSRL
jgi:hypothetical protein